MSVAGHLVLEGCIVLMTREFGETGGTRMAAAAMGPAIKRSIALAKAVATAAPAAATATLFVGRTENTDYG
jgi:hypothetical protein